MFVALACLLACALVAMAASLPQAPARQQQEEKDKDKDKQKGQPKKEEKPAGLFGGTKAVTGMKRGSETELTASAGAKGVGEGKQIGETPVTAADREKVARMASAMPAREEMKVFLEKGKLATERKGGSQ